MARTTKTIQVPMIQLQLGRCKATIPAKKGYVWCTSNEIVVKICGLADAKKLENFCENYRFESDWYNPGKWNQFQFSSFKHTGGETDKEMADDGHYSVQTVNKFVDGEIRDKHTKHVKDLKKG